MQHLRRQTSIALPSIGLLAALLFAVGCNQGNRCKPGHTHDSNATDTGVRGVQSDGGTDTGGFESDTAASDTSTTDPSTSDTENDPDTTSTDAGQDPCIGGGECYANRLCESGSGPTVDNRNDLVDAVQNASNGDVVYVAGDAEIDLEGESLAPADGVTIASDRGCGGSAGGLLYSDNPDARLIVTDADDVRVTGLRIGGPFRDQKGVDDLYDGDGWDAGVRIGGENSTVDNNELYGFRYVAVDAEGPGAHVHHNTIHYNAGDGLGYGVVSGTNARPMPLIEYNYFNFNRHAVVTHEERSYEARYNVHGPDMPNHHIYDVHGSEDDCGQSCGGVAGDEILIHHNTVKKKRDPMVSIRGVPSTEAEIESNWFYHPEEEAIIQEKQDPFENVTVQDNHYGTSEPSSCDIGAPRSGCP